MSNERLEEILEEHEHNLGVIDYISDESFKPLYRSLLSQLIKVLEEIGMSKRLDDVLGFNVDIEMAHLKEIINKDDSLTITSRFVKYLIEQAERVQELESRIADDEHYVAEILGQNKRYREVLEIIADKREVDFGNSYTNKAYNHSRKIARQALEGEE